MIHLLASMLIAAAPERVLVYSFTVGINYRTVDSSAGEHGNLQRNEVSDLGTITVNVVGLDPGGGLVVNVAEDARTNRSVAPATCIIFSNTNVLCGSSVVTPEETSILRTLNPKFVDPTALDAKGHWHIAPGSGVSIDLYDQPERRRLRDHGNARREFAARHGPLGDDLHVRCPESCDNAGARVSNGPSAVGHVERAHDDRSPGDADVGLVAVEGLTLPAKPK